MQPKKAAPVAPALNQAQHPLVVASTRYALSQAQHDRAVQAVMDAEKALDDAKAEVLLTMAERDEALAEVQGIIKEKS